MATSKKQLPLLHQNTSPRFEFDNFLAGPQDPALARHDRQDLCKYECDGFESHEEVSLSGTDDSEQRRERGSRWNGAAHERLMWDPEIRGRVGRDG